MTVRYHIIVRVSALRWEVVADAETLVAAQRGLADMLAFGFDAAEVRVVPACAACLAAEVSR